MVCEIYWIDTDDHLRLGLMPRPRGGDWLEDEINSLKKQDVEVLVSLLTVDESTELDLTREAVCCETAGIQFISFPIADRQVPANAADAMRLVNLLHGMVAHERSVVIHCRAGIGRAGIIAACVLKTSGLSADAAFDRIVAARGCPVPDTPEQKAWVKYI